MRRRFPHCLALGFSLLAFASPTFAASPLQWTTRVAELTAKPGAASAEAVFPFKNTGQRPVKIVQVTATCGCTSATSTKEVVAPGETAEIRAVFTIGDRSGPQEKQISVLTDAPDAEREELVLRLDIPLIAQVSPRLLLWRTGDAPEPKQAALRVFASEAFERVELVPPADTVQAQLETVTEKQDYRLVLHPASTGQEQTIPVVLKVHLAEGVVRTYTVFAAVR
ncbi:MAG TPA: DUF1573 domain-containing protein [Opitutaceae bacterium]